MLQSWCQRFSHGGIVNGILPVDIGEELIKLVAQNGVLGIFSALLVLAVIYLARDRQKILFDRVVDAKKTVEERIADGREVVRMLERSTAVLDHLADAETARIARVKEFFDDMRDRINEARVLTEETQGMVKSFLEEQKTFRADLREQLRDLTKDAPRGRR